MSLNGLCDILVGHPAYRRLLECMRLPDAVHETGAPDAARPYLISALWRSMSVPVLVVAPRPDDARRLHDQVLTYLGEDEGIFLFPESEVLPFERLIADTATNNQRMLTLGALRLVRDRNALNARADYRPPLVIASAAALLRKTLTPRVLDKAWHTLEVGMSVHLADLFSRWIALGYQRDDGVEVPGSFSHRGGIVDIYPPSSPLPARLELLGDEIESIRLFDPVSQRSVRPVDWVGVIPAREILPSLADRDEASRLIEELNFSRCTPGNKGMFQEDLDILFSDHNEEPFPIYSGFLNHGSVMDHFPEDGLVVLERSAEIEVEALEAWKRAEEMRVAREERGELPANFPSPQIPWTVVSSALEGRRRLLLNGWNDQGGIEFRPAPSYYGKQQQLPGDVREMLRGDGRVVFVTRYPGRLAEVLAESGVTPQVLSSLESTPSGGSLSLVSGALREGWVLDVESGRVTILSDSEVFGTAKERRTRKKRSVKREIFMSEMLPGGYVVHVDHGVARFVGTVPMDLGKESKEYLVLEYAEGDRIYVPTDYVDRVSPYHGPSDQPPVLTRLGTQEWTRTKERAKESAREMTRELLELYAARQIIQGHASSPDSPWQRELEDAFPYEETWDQERTIKEVKEEMELDRPMDRLVCGDVGYGKTEVALRSAFKAVNDGRQVAILVPTTILAQQHYVTFSERLNPFPMRVEVLSRFRTRKEQEEVLEGLEIGTVDIVIGTHRLLQKDVKFSNLGLVVVDEEQRFGVADKERLKRMRQEVDMLTLSATPIPRTLYMGLSGMRDMSTIETPPEERLPVKTYVAEYSDDVVKEAVLRELERGGQVFFLHNRVQTIRRAAENLKKLAPHARIAIGHGRMAEGDLEETMVAFSQGDVDVLVCTTIIESGLDIPNANTLIIDRADRFGLSQLYQLRGRVGRGSHRAYAYLLTPRGRRITEAAGKRLKAILEVSELGAGFRIALRDLEIRGAGNVLGAEQSGHIHAVGFELYTQLLDEVVQEIRANEGNVAFPGDGRATAQVKVNLALSAYIPEKYILHLPTRLAIYQRLTRVRDRREALDIREELRDRFGALPSVVDNLLYLVELKILGGEARLESISQSGPTVTLTLLESVGGAQLALENVLGPGVRVGNQQVHIGLSGEGDRWKRGLMEVLERLLTFREQMGLLALPG